MGFRTVLEPEAISYEKIEASTGSEFRMRVRVAGRSLRALVRSKWALNIFSHTKLAWQLWSHKVLRYSVPFFLILLFISCFLSKGEIYRLFLMAQLFFYVLALWGHFAYTKSTLSKLFSIPFYFCLVNIASLIAFIQIAKGNKYITWETNRN